MKAAVRAALAIVLLAASSALATGAPGSPAHAAPTADPPPTVTASDGTWDWPATGLVVAPYRAPAHAYGAGHRGIDILASHDTVVAPDDGVVLFVGIVADRPLLTIDHGAGLVSTLEPVRTELAPGAVVRRGEAVGHLAAGGHARPGALHLGARQDGEYLNPLRLLDEVPRAILLPCC
jgi:murein DD-endopeptidase MepM/ murein hydrolase activator NlpD